jgi:hypothetical protein
VTSEKIEPGVISPIATPPTTLSREQRPKTPVGATIAEKISLFFAGGTNKVVEKPEDYNVLDKDVGISIVVEVAGTETSNLRSTTNDVDGADSVVLASHQSTVEQVTTAAHKSGMISKPVVHAVPVATMEGNQKSLSRPKIPTEAARQVADVGGTQKDETAYINVDSDTTLARLSRLRARTQVIKASSPTATTDSSVPAPLVDINMGHSEKQTVSRQTQPEIAKPQFHIPARNAANIGKRPDADGNMVTNNTVFSTKSPAIVPTMSNLMDMPTVPKSSSKPDGPEHEGRKQEQSKIDGKLQSLEATYTSAVVPKLKSSEPSAANRHIPGPPSKSATKTPLFPESPSTTTNGRSTLHESSYEMRQSTKAIEISNASFAASPALPVTSTVDTTLSLESQQKVDSIISHSQPLRSIKSPSTLPSLTNPSGPSTPSNVSDKSRHEQMVVGGEIDTPQNSQQQARKAGLVANVVAQYNSLGSSEPTMPKGAEDHYDTTPNRTVPTDRSRLQFPSAVGSSGGPSLLRPNSSREQVPVSSSIGPAAQLTRQSLEISAATLAIPSTDPRASLTPSTMAKVASIPKPSDPESDVDVESHSQTRMSLTPSVLERLKHIPKPSDSDSDTSSIVLPPNGSLTPSVVEKLKSIPKPSDPELNSEVDRSSSADTGPGTAFFGFKLW